MATAPPTPVPSPAAPSLVAPDPAWPDSVWRAPLVPAALAVTAGVVLDRYAAVPLPVSLVAAAATVLAWLLSRGARQQGLPLVYLALAGAAFGSAYHHYRRDIYRADDIGEYAPAEPRPALLRGVVDKEPPWRRAPAPDPLRSFDRPGYTSAVLRATQVHTPGGWVEASGRVRLHVAGPLSGLHVGDEVEAVGQLSALEGPANPGEFDYSSQARDEGIRAQLVVRKTADGVTRLARGWPRSFAGWVARTRAWGQGVLARELPERTRGLGMALLLGDGSPMTPADWEKYVRTGVIYVLAISGQHLVILAAALWWLLRLLGVRQRHGALLVALFLLAYALLTGGRPPAMRSAVAVCAASGGVILRRRTQPANLFALAWLVVALLNPTDLFTAGCQLSFLSVAVLYWGTRGWFARETDSLQRRVQESRPAWQRGLRGLGWWVGTNYALTALIWPLVTPFAASSSHTVPPVALFLGPPLTHLTTIALFFGFALLLSSPCQPVATPCAWVMHRCLVACESLVDQTEGWPGSYFYIGDIPEWWLWISCLGLLAALTQPSLRARWRWCVMAGLGWLCVGLLPGAPRLPADELRCTFLAVGHGCCAVLETPDGRTLLYDAGALAGPEVTGRRIAPFLWHRGVRRIDEVFLSHGDLDHFNGLVPLLDRFAVGQVTCTPTFAEKDTRGVALTLDALRRHGIPVRVVRAGNRLAAGDVQMDVLHPPTVGPEGNENARSLVLLVRHAGHTLLLTGDLEGPGLERVLALPQRHVDVLMAPHHGSRLANTPALATWARPRVVVACQGPPRWPPRGPAEPYSARGAVFLGTWPHGAVTVRSHQSGLVVETYVTGQRLVLRTSAAGR
jgi:competence protein ComEC